MPSRQTVARVDEYLDFRAALRHVLESGDPAELKAFLRDSGRDLRDADLSAMGRWTEEALLPIMHRMIVADAKLAARHSESRNWLRERNLALRVGPTGYGWGTELRRRYRTLDVPGQARSA